MANASNDDSGEEVEFNALEQYRDSDLATSGTPIGFYEREFYPLSNFSSFQVKWRGMLWPTSEHAYQATKFFGIDESIVEEIHQARSAHIAFKLAKEKFQHLKPDSWKRRKIGIMEEICRHKLTQHKYVEKKLMQTGRRPLVEDSPKDDFWGWGPNRSGRNELGKVWMRLRSWWREDTV